MGVPYYADSPWGLSPSSERRYFRDSNDRAVDRLGSALARSHYERGARAVSWFVWIFVGLGILALILILLRLADLDTRPEDPPRAPPAPPPRPPCWCGNPNCAHMPGGGYQPRDRREVTQADVDEFSRRVDGSGYASGGVVPAPKTPYLVGESCSPTVVPADRFDRWSERDLDEASEE